MIRTPSIRLAGATITNPSKLFWPDEQLTKRDLAQFYRRTARYLLPWMRERALTLERCPDGVGKACFYQKEAPKALPDGIPTAAISAPTAGRTINYVVGGALKTLLTLVNLGCVSVHVMNGRIDNVDSPDWMSFDLDPTTGITHVVEVALLLKARLEDHGLESFVKTSGGRGLHVFVPLRRGATQDRVRAYAADIAGEIARAHPRLVTVEARKARRRAPVYLDVMRNARAQTIVAPYGVRWRPKAPVSMPLGWDEVTPRLDPTAFNVRTVEHRLAHRTPWADFFRKRQTLPRA